MTPPVLDPCSSATLAAIAQHATRVLASPRPEADLLIPGWLLGDEIPAPRVGEGGRCNLCGCGAVRAPTCPRLSAYIRALFHSAAAGMTAVGAPTAVSRFDLHHGHLFLSRGDPPTLGLLLHAREYPALGDAFPHALGHCQAGSSLIWDARAAAARNALWLLPAPRGGGDGAGARARLALLDTGPGAPAAARLLAPEGAELGTVYEGLLGAPLCDVTLFERSFFERGSGTRRGAARRGRGGRVGVACCSAVPGCALGRSGHAAAWREARRGGARVLLQPFSGGRAGAAQ